MDKLSLPGWLGPPIGAVVAVGMGIAYGQGLGASIAWLALWALVGASAGGVVWLADASIRRRRLNESDSRAWRPAVESPVARGGIWFGLILSLTIGPFVAYLGVERFIAARHMLNWPTAPATILESYIRTSSHTNLDVTAESYTPIIRYRYAAGGAERESGVIDHAPSNVSYGDRGEAEAVVARHPAGSVCPVYYDPANPARAILEPGVRWKDSIPFLVVPIAAAGIALLCAVALRAEQGEPES